MKQFRSVGSRLLCLLVLCTILLTSATASSLRPFAQEENRRTVRVFYPLQEHLSEQDALGRFSGYAYEYLMRLAQLTGWEYSFEVVGGDNQSLSDGLDAVKNGTLDLAISMAHLSQMEADYLYSANPYGQVSYTLIALKDRQSLNSRTIGAYPDLRVALVEDATGQNQLFEDYCARTGITYSPVYAADNDACLALLSLGQVDAFIGKNISTPSGCKTVLSFGAQPFYFATAKGNVQLMDELNCALVTLHSAQPMLQHELAQRYFSDISAYNSLPLTTEELAFIQEAPPIRVAVPIGRAPVQDCNEDGAFFGMMIDMLEEIAQISGLQFQFIATEDRAMAQDLLAGNEADIIAGLPYRYDDPQSLFSSQLLLTSPILSMPIVRVSAATGTPSSDTVLVYQTINLPTLPRTAQLEEDIRSILRQIDEHQAAEGYVNGYMAQYYLTRGDFPNLITTPTPFHNYDVCLGVDREIDLRLIGILEHAISALSTERVEQIIFQNTSHFQPTRLLDVFQNDPLPFVLPGLLILLLITVLLLALFLKSRRINRLVSAEGNRYKHLAEIDGLTGILNHATFRHFASMFLTTNELEPSGTLLILDVDYFKIINDSLGHPMGDEVLRGLAKLLTELFQPQCLIGRLGGDEFAVLMKHISDRETIEARCVQLRERAGQILDSLQVTLSIGAVRFEGRNDLEQLLRLGDKALYEVKNAGRNGFRISGDLS